MYLSRTHRATRRHPPESAALLHALTRHHEMYHKPVAAQDVFYGDKCAELPHTVGSMKVRHPDKMPRWRFEYVRIPKHERRWSATNLPCISRFP